MRADQFLRLAERHLPELVRRYHLRDWWIDVAVVEPDQLSSPTHAAETHLDEPYRKATILVNRQDLRAMSPEKAMAVLEHEVQHITAWWLEDLRGLVLAALEDADEAVVRMVERGFHRVHELYRSTLGRLLKAGNNWEVD